MNGDKNTSQMAAWSSIASNLLTPTAAIVALVIEALNKFSTLPAWFVYVPIILIIIWVFVFGISRVNQIRLLWQKRNITKSHFLKLQSLVQQFSRLISLQHSDTITYAFQNHGQLLNRPFADLAVWWTNNLIDRLQTSRPTFEQLRLGIYDLRALIHSYHRLYLIDHLSKVAKLEDSTISDEERKTAELARESFAMYIDKFQTFCGEIDRATRTEIFTFYFEKAKPLL